MQVFFSATLQSFFLAVAFSGSVVSAFDVVGYDCIGSPTICAGACYFTRPGASGEVFDTIGLNYDKNSRSSLRANKRRTAIGCGSNNYCKQFGLSCDEYPQASTYQGGLGVASQGYRAPSLGETTCVPQKEQNYQGGLLSGLYRNKPDGWNFIAVAQNYQDIPQCINSDPATPPPHYHLRTSPRTQRRFESAESLWSKEVTNTTRTLEKLEMRLAYQLSNNQTITPLIGGFRFALGEEFNYTDITQADQTELVKVVQIIALENVTIVPPPVDQDKLDEGLLATNEE